MTGARSELRRTAVLCLLIGSAPTTASGRIFGIDDRTLSDVALFPYSAQCRLLTHFAGEKGDCWHASSGVLVGAGTGGTRHCLTAAHCIYNPSRGGWADAVRVAPALDGQKTPFGEYHAVRLRALSAFTSDHDERFDIGLLTLDRPVDPLAGCMLFAYVPDFIRKNGCVSGYPGEPGKAGRQYHSNGPITGADEHQVLYRIAETPGTR